jgi:very-short-patch-repair endonuclease
MKTVTSLELTNMINDFRHKSGKGKPDVRHNDILEKIRKVGGYEISSYSIELPNRGKKNSVYYIIPETIANEFIAGEELSVRPQNKHIENDYITSIQELFGNKVKTIREYKIGKYRVDLYVPCFNLFIEIDEDYHINQQADDKLREKELKRLRFELEINRGIMDMYDRTEENFTKVIRIPEGQLIQGFRKIIQHIEEKYNDGFIEITNNDILSGHDRKI